MSKKNSRFREDAKYWLEPSAAALAKLEEIQSSVTSMKPASSYNVQSVWVPSSSTPPSSSRGKVVKASPYTELETKPPLSSLSIQKTAWGSNTSIPDLIKQQGERQKLRDARGPRRPWSGRKVPPSPTAQRRASQGGLASESAAELTGAFIAVKGSKSVMYDPGTNSRPQSGRSQSASSSTVPHSESHDVFAMMEAANTYRPTSQESGEEQDNALEEFLRSQPDGQRHELSKLSAAYADERNITPPPPPPCASPDLEKLINGGLEAEGSDNDDGGDGDDVPDDDGAEEIVDRFEARTPKQVSPQLLRRPTPEPIKLSMTLPGADVEEDYSTDEDGSSDAPSPQLSPDIEVQSISSESFAQLAPYQSQFQSGTPASNGPSHNGITSVSVTPRSGATTTVKNRVDDSEDSAGTDKTANRNRSKGKLSVQFVEEKNVTFDITPRGPVTTLRPRPPSAGRERHRPQSALKSSKFNKANTTDSRTAHSLSLTRSSRPLSAGRGRHFSSSEGDGDDDEDDDEDFVSSDSQVGADKMMDTLNNNSSNETSDRHGQMKPGRRQDIETMMSRLALPQNEEKEAVANTKEAEERVPRGTPQDITRTIQVSSSASSRKNFYEKAINAKKKSMYQQRQAAAAAARTLTTKVIEYGENGPTMETKGVSYLQVGATPSQSKPVRPGSLKGPKKGWEDGRTQVNRPTMEKKSLVEQLQDRPTSRMGMYEDADSAETNEGPETSGQAQALALQRARPKSAVLRSKQEVTGHRHGKKSPTPSKQRPHSSFVNSSSPAKPPRRNSSPSGRAHSNSNRALTPTIRKSKAERQRTRAAVRALKDGSLTKNKMFDKQIKSVHSDPGAMRVYQSKRQQDKESDADSDSIDEYPKSVREEEIFNLHRHLLKNGVHISFKTLKRGLVAPGEKNVQECVEQLPSNTSLGLLSQPSAWLGQVYEKYRIAESALRRADHQLAVQEERAVKEAQRLLEASRMTAGGRKKKRKKVTKKKTKSPSSSSATSSRPLSSASVVEREKEKRTSETSVLSAASLLFPPQTDVDVQ
ncbi:uncharacterized protein [Diadema setosum]|uniref:uncharacterized protein n=1 Tax=Diadema setosum TaxID=31175 RepID=UPI003B3BA7C6